jgi:hypothetical protein
MGRVEYAICVGTKKDGSSCTKPGAKKHFGYCSLHKDQNNRLDKDQMIADLIKHVNELQIEIQKLKQTTH